MNRRSACAHDLANVSSQRDALDSWPKVDTVVDSYMAEYIHVKPGQPVKVRESTDQESIQSNPHSPPA